MDSNHHEPYTDYSGNRRVVGKSEARVSRSDLFSKWLTDMNPDKVKLLVDLERKARLVTHVRTLTGDTDDKLVVDMMKTVEELRNAYQQDPGK